jgi:hypothetical protein
LAARRMATLRLNRLETDILTCRGAAHLPRFFAQRLRTFRAMMMQQSPAANTSPVSARAPARERFAGNQRPWPADKVERRAIDRLIPYAKNARTHTDAQVAAIAASIREWGWTASRLKGLGKHAYIRLSRSCRCGKAKASIRWPMKAPRLRNSNGKLIRTLSR